MFMYFAIKRILRGVVLFVIIIFMQSAIFNTTAEKTLRSQIEDVLNAEVRSLVDMPAEHVEAYILERRDFYYRLYWLDKSVWERIIFRTWTSVTFNFGRSSIMTSTSGDRDVGNIIKATIPRTIALFSTAVVISTIIGISLGLLKARWAGSRFDRGTSIVTMILSSLPSWWIAMIFMMFFVYVLKIFPSGGLHSVPLPTGIKYYTDMLWHLALPLLTLVSIGFWGYSYSLRNIVLGTLQEDFIMSARARGIPEKKILFGHTLRCAAPAVVTTVLLSFMTSIIGGNIVFEGLFSWPGFGRLNIISLQQNDVPVILGISAISVAIYQVGLIILDLSYGFLDPRIKVGGKD